MLPPSPTGLYWSRGGMVTCPAHTPAADEPIWRIEGWSALPEDAQGRHGLVFQCQECAPSYSLLARPPAPVPPSES